MQSRILLLLPRRYDKSNFPYFIVQILQNIWFVSSTSGIICATYVQNFFHSSFSLRLTKIIWKSIRPFGQQRHDIIEELSFRFLTPNKRKIVIVPVITMQKFILFETFRLQVFVREYNVVRVRAIDPMGL